MLEVMDNNQRWPEGGVAELHDMLIERAKLLGDSKCVDGREGNVVSPWKRIGQPLPDLKAEVSGLPFTDSFMLIPTSKKDVKFLRELAVRW